MEWAVWVLTAVWFLIAFISLLNFFLIPRAKPRGEKFGTVLIPARDEVDNLKALLPQLVQECELVVVYDDGSTDGTGEVARELGATVVRGHTDLPPGWTGKNHACWQLAKVAAEISPSSWWLFLDADTRVEPGFGGALLDLAQKFGKQCPVVTAFPKMLSGKFPEPAYLVWVPWILLGTIPFGLIQSSGLGHARFTNGQFVLWDPARYFEINPHETCKGEVLEDIQIGRLLARLGVPVATVDASAVLSVRMYRDIGEAWKGMLKNSFWVTGRVWGALALGVLLWGLAAVVFLNPFAAIFGLVSFAATLRATRLPWWCLPLFPVSVASAGITQWASVFAVRKGVAWKGRRYGLR
ncbi:MAG: glycosyltransferase [Armatimonadetes bacterium]|nr:glycosyltransferase [Armatimonadota bacterium]